MLESVPPTGKELMIALGAVFEERTQTMEDFISISWFSALAEEAGRRLALSSNGSIGLSLEKETSKLLSWKLCLLLIALSAPLGLKPQD
jgi:hypothetical protein